VGYELQAVIAEGELLRPVSHDFDVGVAPLGQGSSLMLMTDGLIDVLSDGGAAHSRGFWRLPGGFDKVLATWSNAVRSPMWKPNTSVVSEASELPVGSAEPSSWGHFTLGRMSPSRLRAVPSLRFCGGWAWWRARPRTSSQLWDLTATATARA
jgi:hypothetical protein